MEYLGPIEEPKESPEQGGMKYLGPIEGEKPSYWEAAKTGFREGISGALRFYEAPFKPIAKAMGIPPGLEASEWIKPSEEEIRRTQELSIPGQVVRGAAGIPGAIAKYAPISAVTGPMAGFAIPEAAETLAEGKPISEVARRTAEGLAVGTGFKYLPSSLKYRVPGMAALFGGQALYETGEPKEAIAPAIVGAGMGFMGGRGRREIPRPEPSAEIKTPIEELPIPRYRPPVGSPSEVEWPYQGEGFMGRPIEPTFGRPDVASHEFRYGPEGERLYPGMEEPTYEPRPPITPELPTITREQAKSILSDIGKVETRLGGTRVFATPESENIDLVEIIGGVWKKGESKHDLDIRIDAKAPLNEELIREANEIRGKIQTKSNVPVDVTFMDEKGHVRKGIPEIPSPTFKTEPTGALKAESPASTLTPEEVVDQLITDKKAFPHEREKLIRQITEPRVEPPPAEAEAEEVRAEQKILAAKTAEAKPDIDFSDPRAYRKFIESKGIEWPVKGTQADALKIEFDKAKAEAGRFKVGEVPEKSLSMDEVNSFSDERLGELPNAPPTKIVDTADEIPERLTRELNENLKKGIKGVYDPLEKATWLVRENLESREDVIETINHEAIGHYATEAYLGPELTPFLNRVYLKYGRSGLKDIADQRGFNLDTQEGRLNASREKIAELAETNENPGLLKQFYAWIREQIGKIFPDVKITDAEIQNTIAKARDTLVSGELRAREARIDNLRQQVRNIQATHTEQVPLFSIAGKAKEVGRAGYEEEIKPKAKGFWDTWRGFKKTISPTSGVDVKDMNTMMKFLGDRELAKTKVELATERGIDRINKMSRDEQVRFFAQIQHGEIEGLPPDLKEIANLHRSIEDSLFDKANAILRQGDSKIQIAYLKDHARNFWKVLPKGIDEEIEKRGFSGLWRRPIEGTKGMLKHQVYTMEEGIERGGVPHTTNLLESTRLNYEDTYKLITANEMWKALGDIGHRKFIKFNEVIPDGFRTLDDRIANKYFPPKEAGRWVVEDNVGRILENYLSHDYIRENPALRGLMGIKNITTAFELGFSAFHASFIGLESVASQVGLGMRKMWNQGMIKEGLKDITTAPLAPYKLFKIGNQWARFFKNPDEFIKATGGEDFLKMFPEAKEMIGDLFWGGGSMRMSESYRINSINSFKENLNSKNYIGAFLRSVPAASQIMMKPLFENYIPSIKRAVFLREFSNEIQARSADLLSGKITRPELARNIWSFVENRFGEMNFDNLWWNRTFKSALQMVVRSVTWKLGNIRAYGKAVTGQSSEILSAFREGRMPKLTQEMAWMWGIAATTAAMASIAQYALTGKSPEDWRDLVYPQIDQQGGRLSLPTYMRDLFSAAHHPLNYMWSSTSGFIGRLMDVLKNKDFYGTEVHDPEQNILIQRFDDMIHLVPLPFSVQSFSRLRQEGEPLSRQLAGFLGATKAPYWIEKSPAEQKASELKTTHFPVGGMSAKDFERNSLLRNYARKYQEATLKGESPEEVMTQLRGDISSGKLRMQDLIRFRQKITREPLVQTLMSSMFPLKDAVQVWNVATSEQKKQIAPILMRKYSGLKLPEDRALYLPKIQEIITEMRR